MTRVFVFFALALFSRFFPHLFKQNLISLVVCFAKYFQVSFLRPETKVFVFDPLFQQFSYFFLSNLPIVMKVARITPDPLCL